MPEIEIITLISNRGLKRRGSYIPNKTPSLDRTKERGKLTAVLTLAKCSFLFNAIPFSCTEGPRGLASSGRKMGMCRFPGFPGAIFRLRLSPTKQTRFFSSPAATKKLKSALFSGFDSAHSQSSEFASKVEPLEP